METTKITKVLKCEKCGARLRVPTDKGTITVTCPSCKDSFSFTPINSHDMKEKKKQDNIEMSMGFLYILIATSIMVGFFWHVAWLISAMCFSLFIKLKSKLKNEKKKQQDEKENQRKADLLQYYRNFSYTPQTIALLNIDINDKIYLLQNLHGYQSNEAARSYCIEIINEAKKVLNKQRKYELRKQIRKLYGLSSDSREPIPGDVQKEVVERDGGKCVKCGSREDIEIDHIIPVSKGGSSTANNLQILCKKCNREKSDNIG